MTSPNTTEDELDKILAKLDGYDRDIPAAKQAILSWHQSLVDEVVREARIDENERYESALTLIKQQQQAYADWVIGEDEDARDRFGDARKKVPYKLFRNSLRAEQRSRNTKGGDV